MSPVMTELILSRNKIQQHKLPMEESLTLMSALRTHYGKQREVAEACGFFGSQDKGLRMAD